MRTASGGLRRVFSGLPKWCGLALAMGSMASELGAVPGSAIQAESEVRREQLQFEKLLSWASGQPWERLPMGSRIEAVARQFLGVPYASKSLEDPGLEERLVVDFDRMDCVTFFENVVAFSRVLGSPRPSLEGFKAELQRMRYRDGVIAGFPSRLHYLTDHLRNNERNHLVRNITLEVGGGLTRLDRRSLHFMSTHPEAYPALASGGAVLDGIRSMEADLNRVGGRSYIPKAKVRQVEARIQTGDIVAITTNIQGLDCSHVGLALRGEKGRIRLIHASPITGKVTLSQEPLAEYLARNAAQTGIILARPLEAR